MKTPDMHRRDAHPAARRPNVEAPAQALRVWAARLGVLMALLATPGCLRAVRMARAAPPGTGSEARVEKEWPTPDEVVTLLDERLSLTEDQKARIRPIVAARQEEMKALAADTSPGRQGRARRAKAILEDSDRAIEALLTEEQKTSYRTVQAQMRAEARERMQRRQGTVTP